MASYDGQVIKGYELRERIGGGGFGEVYRAYQTLLKREVAIKIILPQHANQPEFIRRFEVEAELVARLEHPFIVPLFDYWRDANGAFLVMRLLRGGSLEDRVDSGPMAVNLVANILDQIAGALNVAHRNNVVHRDLKPANILLDEDENAYLADFGIAKDVTTTTQSDTTGMLTPNYAAPEQFKGDPVSARTDIYNLGLTLYELLTGQPPYGGSLHEVIFHHINDSLPSLLDMRPDLPPALDEVLLRATEKEPGERFPSALALAAAFRNALAGIDPLAVTAPADLTETTRQAHDITMVDDTAALENPYKGLRAFREGDADDFFGRDDLSQRLLGRLDVANGGERFLAVVGPSGSGKSSVVRAALIPALRDGALAGSGDWFITEMFPGAHPMAELEAALLRVAVDPPNSLLPQLEEDERGLMRASKRLLPHHDDTELVLLIDQFEELFTQVEDEAARLHFLNSLRIALDDPNSRLRVIVTIRADFYDRPLQYEALGELMRRQTEVVLPLAAHELEAAIIEPARQIGVTLETGLARAIVEDVGEQPGTLPLLQYALTELFEHRQGRVLTLAAYQEINGVTGALARRADDLYRQFGAEGQEAVRQLFLRLVTLGEGTEDTRRRVRRAEVGTSAQLDDVIETYGQYRLLTFDRDPVTRGPTVEVAHEALIRTWERLGDWIEDSREDLRVQRRLTAAAAEWLTSGRNPDFLASGARLTQFEEWSQATALSLNDDEHAYLDTSIEEEAARRARDEAVARRVQNLGRATIILVVMIVIAVIATVVLLNQANDAQSRAGAAQTQVALAGQTLTPIPNTLTPLAEELLAGNRLLATAEYQVAIAQAQIDNVGATLTPAQGTAIAAQIAADEAKLLAGVAQTQAAAAQQQVDSVGATLTPQQATIAAAQQQVENVGATLTPVQGTVVAAQADALEANQLANSAQTQVAQVGATLTPVQATLDGAASRVQQANQLADAAQTQVADAVQQVISAGATLTPQQATIVAAEEQVAHVGATLTPQQLTVVAAQSLVENVGATLTPVQGTVVAAQADALEANQLANSAQTQVAQVGATLTPVQATLDGAASRVQQANQLADAAQTQVADAVQQVISAGATLTPQQATIAAAEEQVANVGATLTPQQLTVVAAQSLVEYVGATLTPVQGTIVAAQADALEANQLANSAQTQVAQVGATLTPVQVTLAAAQRQFEQANALALAAQTQVADAEADEREVRLTLTPVQITLAAAQSQIEQANALALAAQTQVADAEADEREVYATLTPVQATVIAVQAQVANVAATLTPQQATIIAAEAQIENVGTTLTPQQATVAAAQAQIDNVGLTLTPQQATIAAAQQQADNVGATLTPQQATIAAAQALVENVGLTLTPVQATVVAARADAGSISLAVSAEQAVNNSNYDLALALVLESMKLNPDLTQPQRLLNQIAFSSARMSFENARAVEFSPNNRVVVAAQGNLLAAWNIDSRQPLDQLEGHAGQILDAAFSPNGQLLATASQDASVIVYDVSGWRFGERATELYRLTAHGGAVNTVMFNPASTLLLTGSDDSQIISWEARAGAEIRRFVGNPWPVKQLDYAEGGRDFFAWADASGTRILSLWNGANGNRIYTDDQLVFETFSPSRRNAFVGGLNTPLQIRNAGNRGLVREFVRGFNWATDTTVSTAFRPFNGAEVLIALDSSSNDSRLLLADVASGEVIRRFQGDAAGRVNALAFNPDGTLALSGNGNQLVLWDVSRGTAIRRLAAHNDLIDTIEFSPDGRFALSTARDGNARVWDITSGDGAVLQQLRVTVEIPERASPHIAGFHPSRNTVYTGVWIDLIEWSAQTGQHTGTVSVGAPIRNTLFSPTEPHVVTILENVAILWNLDRGTQGLMDRFANSDDLFNGAGAYSPNGAFLALDGRSQIYVYDMTSRQRIKSINKPQLPNGFIVTGLAITPDGQRVIGATGMPDTDGAAVGDMIVWDVTSGNELFRYPVEHTRTINHISISPDGRSLLSASDDNTLILWELGSGQVLKRFAGHSDDVNVGLFGPDPARPLVLSASDDATLILWDINSGQPIRSFRGHTQGITGLNISADGRRMISSTSGDTVIVWRIETTEQIVNWTLANRYVRPLTADECNQYDVRDCNAQLDLAPVATLPAAGPTATFLPTFTPGAPTATRAPSERVFASNTGSQNVNVRSSDSTSAPIVAVLGVNEQVEVIGQSSRGTGWLQIILSDGRLAWVSGSVVSLSGDRASIQQVEPPPVVQQVRPTQRPSTDSGGSTGSGGSGETTPPEEDVPLYDCSAFRLTSPIGYINIDQTTFYWDTLPGAVNADYWLTIFNEQGQNVAIANAGSASNVTVNTSIAGIGGGFAFSYEVTVFVDGEAVCPGSGSVGQRPTS